MPDPVLEPAAPLPQASILNYVTNATTPTQVRIVTGRAVYVLAAFDLLAAFVCIGWMVYDTLHRWDLVTLRAMPWSLLMKSIPDNEGSLVFAMVTFLLASGIHCVCAAPVQRGSVIACKGSMAAMAPLGIAVLVGTFAAGCRGAMDLIPYFVLYRSAACIPWFALGLAGCVGILLLRDVSEFIGWIMRNPAAEKPTVNFLPGGRLI